MHVNETYVDLAGRLAEASGKIVRRHFRSLSGVGEKQDSTPVTIADKEAEIVMREMIQVEYPDHGIVGEEGSNTLQNNEFVWVLDPIDGTKNYASGSYQFGTLISLLKEGTCILGIIDQPVLKERWLGVRGEPTTFNGDPVQVRTCDELTQAWMYSSSPDMFRLDNKKKFARLASLVKYSLFGTDCIGYGLVASGFTDIICEAQMRLWDYTAHIPIIEGAGGVISDWMGNPLTPNSRGTVLACGDMRVHEAALEALSEPANS